MNRFTLFRGTVLKVVLLVVTSALATVALPKPADAWMCVTHVRNMTGITTIRGDAWAWWHNAEGQFARGSIPTPGSIMVWRRAGNLPLGHVGVVREVIDSRTVLVDHSWDSNALRTSQPIVDVSDANDWSQVTVWYHPRQVMGSEYRLYGFVYPHGTEPSSEAMAEILAAQETEQAALSAARQSITRQLDAAGRIGSERAFDLTDQADQADQTDDSAPPAPTQVRVAAARSSAVVARAGTDQAAREALEIVRAARNRVARTRSVVGGPAAVAPADAPASATPVDPAVLAARARQLAAD